MRTPFKILFVLSLIAATVSVAAQGTATQQTQGGYQPQVSQAGKDVVWVPTPQVLVDKMLDMAKVTPKDYLMDLGSGDGRTVITAAKRGLRAEGIEYNPDMVEFARKNAAAAGVSDRAKFTQADLFATDFSKADVITLFLLPDLNERLRPIILKMKPGTRVVSNSFPMGDWEPDQRVTIPAPTCEGNWCTALFWVVPAPVAGTWEMAGGPLVLTTQYQMVSGTLGSMPISGGKMNGSELTFTAGGKKYTGTVSGKTITGAGWTATQK